MANTELQNKYDKQAEIVVNNSFIDSLSKQLELKKQYGLTFPKDYNPTNALMGAYLELKESKDKKLETCSQTSIVNSLLDMVTLGLSVQKKQGYFISYGNKCQFQQSYFGAVTIARRYGLKTINADVIYQGDTFRYHKENAVTVIDEHQQELDNIDNTKIIGAYAVAIMQDGTKVAEIMNLTQLRNAWNQRFGGLKEDDKSIHVKFREEMSKKTVTKRLLKKIINTFAEGDIPETVEKLEENEEVDTIEEDVKQEIKENANTVDFAEAIEETEKEVVIEEVEDIPECFK